MPVFEVVAQVRSKGIEMHAWDVEGEQTLKTIADLGIPRFSSDNPEQALRFRDSLTI
jgi:glycerophosphoryl diester phosphodiesterase